MISLDVGITRLPHGAGLPLPAYQSAEAAGPTAIPTRSLPVGASSLIAWSAAMMITPKNAIER